MLLLQKPILWRYHSLFFGIFTILLCLSIFPTYFWGLLAWKPGVIFLGIFLLSLLLYILLFYLTGFNRSPVLRVAEYVLEKIPDIWFDIALFSIGWIVLIIAKKYILGGYSIMVDTNAQLTQARIMASGKWVVQNTYPDADKVLFNMGLHKPWLCAEYPPGYILFLTLFTYFHAIQYTGPFMGALALPLIHHVGHLVGGRVTGRLAALFLITSPFWIILSIEGMDHVMAFVLLLILIGSLILLSRRRTMLWAILSGGMVSWTFATRPLNGVVYGLFALLVLASLRPFNKNMKLIAGFIIGILPMLFFLFFYNFQTTGSPWMLGFTAANSSWHRMGFNFNGIKDYTLSIGLERLYASGISLNYWLFSWPVLGMLPVILWWLKSKKTNVEWFLFILVLGQIGAYFCYHFHDLFFGPRFWYETIGPILLLSASALAQVIRFPSEKEKEKKDSVKYASSTIIITTLFLFTLYSLLYILPTRASKYVYMKERGVYFEKAYENITFPSKSILLVSKEYQDWIGVFGPPMSESLYYVNDGDLSQDMELKKRYSDWNYFRFDADKGVWEKLE